MPYHPETLAACRDQLRRIIRGSSLILLAALNLALQPHEVLALEAGAQQAAPQFRKRSQGIEHSHYFTL